MLFKDFLSFFPTSHFSLKGFSCRKKYTTNQENPLKVNNLRKVYTCTSIENKFCCKRHLGEFFSSLPAKLCVGAPCFQAQWDLWFTPSPSVLFPPDHQSRCQQMLPPPMSVTCTPLDVAPLTQELTPCYPSTPCGRRRQRSTWHLWPNLEDSLFLLDTDWSKNCVSLIPFCTGTNRKKNWP